MAPRLQILRRAVVAARWRQARRRRSADLPQIRQRRVLGAMQAQGKHTVVMAYRQCKRGICALLPRRKDDIDAADKPSCLPKFLDFELLSH